MKVLHLIDHLGLGGAQYVVKTLVESSNEKFIHKIFPLRRAAQCISIDSKYICHYKMRSRYSILTLFFLFRYIRQNKIDIVHAHLNASLIISCFIMLIFPNVKFVFHEHGGISSDRKLYSILLKSASLKLAKIISVSYFIESKLKTLAINQNIIQTLYNPVDCNTGIYTEINTKPYTVGFAGRLVERKGWQTLLKSAKYLQDKNYRYLIAGIGPDNDKIKAFIEEHKLQQKVTLLGFVSDMRYFYSQIDCFVTASYLEPMGLTPVEAWCSKVPVIATDVPAYNEFIENNVSGLLFEKNNYVELSKLIVNLENDYEMKKKLIKNGFEKARNFHSSNYIHKLEEMYSYL